MYLHNTLYFDFLISCKSILFEKLFLYFYLKRVCSFIKKDVAKINKYFKRTQNAKNNLTVC